MSPSEILQVAVIAVYLGILSVLAVYGFHRAQLLYLYWKHKNRAPTPPGRFEELPRVTVQLPMFNEMYVAERLIESVAAIDYPKDKLEIQVLDDSTDETQTIAKSKVEELVERGFDAVYIHRTERTGFKAGALEHGLKVAKGDYLMVFDADFVPTRTIILDLVHHFTDPKVGMVQARWGHLNRDYSMLTRVQSMMLDGHFVVEHIARNRSGRFFNFNGTAGIWRKSTIIDAGGWQHDTLTEDLDLSFRAQLRGWRFVFVPDVVTPAELPVEMNGFKSQQHRWVKGSIQTSKKLLKDVVRAPIPLHVKAEGVLHLTGNTAYLLTLFLALIMFPVTYFRPKLEMQTSVILELVVFGLATFSVCVFYLCSQAELYGWRGVLGTILYTPMLLCVGIGMCLSNARAVIEGLMTRGGEFVRTPKYAIRRGGDTFVGKKYKVSLKKILPFLELGLGAGFAWVIYYSCRHGMYGAVPFQALFLVGFLYVAFLSLFQGRLTSR
jgi:cellulose synthase/poly-beta-1,6-N-acetylglucosamine synthase-like glycosyltransferase